MTPPPPPAAAGPFPPGSTAVRRDIVNGDVWTAMPLRVLAGTY
ncbi:hypothetical protein [Kitasatospora sp. NPDC097643]